MMQQPDDEEGDDGEGEGEDDDKLMIELDDLDEGERAMLL